MIEQRTENVKVFIDGEELPYLVGSGNNGENYKVTSYKSTTLSLNFFVPTIPSLLKRLKEAAEIQVKVGDFELLYGYVDEIILEIIDITTIEVTTIVKG